MICYSTEEAMNLQLASYLNDYESGTIVIWQMFDRIIDGTANPQKVLMRKLSEHVVMSLWFFIGIWIMNL